LSGVGGVLLVIQEPKTDSPYARPKPLHQRDKGWAIGALSGGLGGKLFVGAMNQINGHGWQRKSISLQDSHNWMPAAAHWSQMAFYTHETFGHKPDRGPQVRAIYPIGTGGQKKCVF
jgi:hypothetical protein